MIICLRHSAKSVRLAWLTAIALSACAEQPAAIPHAFPSADLLARALSPDVELANISGRLRLKRDENAARRDSTLELTQAQATRLGRSFMARFGRSQRKLFEVDARVPIDVGRLRTCRTTRYATGAFSPAGLRLARKEDQLLYSSVWIVPFCDGPEIRAIVSLSAGSNPNAIPEEDGAPMPHLGTAGFFWSGINENDARWILDDPESAVTYAAAQTGARVISAPRLVILPRYRAARPFWRIELDRPVRLASDDDSRDVSEKVVYVGGRESDTQFVPTGVDLFSGLTVPTRKPKKAKLNLGRPPETLARDSDIALEVSRITRINGRNRGERE